MGIQDLFQQTLWSVGELTRYIREIFESDELLQSIWVYGEVSNLSKPSSGHIYFTIKDQSAALKCVIWRSTVSRLKTIPVEGMGIEVHGYLSVYDVAGQYQLYVDQIHPAGEGVLFQQFLRLKARLEEEGLFDPSRKRPIPAFPTKIGIVTSPTAAALKDMLNTIFRRYPAAQVFLSPTAVQGVEAPSGIIKALDLLNKLINPDIILLARGGGSIEDLWAFNDEKVARAIASSEAPVITGIGHETDFTIADFVSDLRAPTPTAAAELATPNRIDLLADLSALVDRLQLALIRGLSERNNLLSIRNRNLSLHTPLRKIQMEQQRLDDLLLRSDFGIRRYLELKKAVLEGINNRLFSLDPQSVLRRGYAIVKHPTGKLITSVHLVEVNDPVFIHLQDGDLEAQINGKKAIE